MKINIVDANCGIGKTTALINKMNNDTSNQKYFFITPLLSEVERIKTSCPNKNFVDPTTRRKSNKLHDVVELLEAGRNIVTTHALFKKFTIEMLETIKKHKYILVMDEVAELIDDLNISKSDMGILTEKYIEVDPKTRMVKWIDNNYKGKFDEYKNIINMNSVFAHIDNKTNTVMSLMWMMPYQVFEAFHDIYILTYLFDGQIQKKYFDLFQSEYRMWYIKDYQLVPEVQQYDYSDIKSRVIVCDSEKLNEIGEEESSLSISWFRRNKRTNKMVELQKNISNFFRSHTEAKAHEMLWTTFKEYKTYVKRKGFIKGFAAINARATNEYSNKTAVAYIGNRYFKPTIKNFFSFNNIIADKEFEEKYALSEIVQFIFRSAIRNGKTIIVYVPSKRMRRILEEWLKKPNI